MAENNVVYDVDFDIVTEAIKNLINQFPALKDEEINFSVIDEDEGISFFPVSGAVVSEEKKDIIGHVEQTCLYPIIVIYKASGLSESAKVKVKEWLDTLGKWLERQIVVVNGIEYQLIEYPKLSGNREFKEIKRTSPSYLMETNESKVDMWAINITATYKNEFDEF